MGDHEDEADAMDRWRLRLTKSVHRGERDLTQLHEKVNQLSSHLLALSSQMQQVASALELSPQPLSSPPLAVPGRALGRELHPSALSSSPASPSPSLSPVGRRRATPSPETRGASPAAVEVVARISPPGGCRDGAGSVAGQPTRPAPLPPPGGATPGVDQ